MKKFLLILSLFVVSSARLLAQDDDDEGNEKIRDKMREYIQNRLDLSDDEAKKFTPVFVRYFKEWRTTLRENRGGSKLDMQQKIVDLQIRYRGEFRGIIGEKKANQVFDHQRKFIAEIRTLGNRRIGKEGIRRNR